jgi:CRP/FNR family transcriptional regulator
MEPEDLIPRTQARSRGQDCALGADCTPLELLARGLGERSALMCVHKHVKRGESLYRLGDPLGSIYPIRAGFFKVSTTSEGGNEQIMGFYMSGEVIGLDAVATQRHASTATAMEDSEVCLLPFKNFEKLCMKARSLQQRFHKIMGQEIAMEQNKILLLGSMSAEERVVSFLLDLSVRFFACGHSSSEFTLRMSREDIGDYLGLTLETVSRTLSRLQKERVLEVDGRHLRILDVPALKRRAGEMDSTA